MGTLVGCETTGETNQEGVWIDFVEQRNDTRRVALILEPVVAETLADVVDEFHLQLHASLPNDIIGHIVDFLPNACVTLVVEEILVEIFSIDFFPFLGCPGREVNAVCYVANVAFFAVLLLEVVPLIVGAELMIRTIFIRQITWPDALEHLLAHLSMQPADTIDFLTSFAQEG